MEREGLCAENSVGYLILDGFEHQPKPIIYHLRLENLEECIYLMIAHEGKTISF
jgi:hypothetical protein